MAVGMRLRRPLTGAVILDTNDYTVSVYHKVIVTIWGSGSMVVSGISLDGFLPVIMPYDYPEPQKWYPEGPDNPPGAPTMTPKSYISGNSVVWVCTSDWQPRTYVIMLLRYK